MSTPKFQLGDTLETVDYRGVTITGTVKRIIPGRRAGELSVYVLTGPDIDIYNHRVTDKTATKASA